MNSVIPICSVYDLVPEFLADKNFVEIPVYGNSMLPFIHSGDCVILRRYDKYRPGDIVLTGKGAYRLHRLLVRKTGAYLTRGDGCRCCDGEIFESDILAKAVYIRHNGKLIDCRKSSFALYSGVWDRLLPLRPLLIRVIRRVSPTR